MALPITGLYGAFHALFNVALAANVSRLRGKTNVFLGTGDSEDLLPAVRRHGNHAEYVALALASCHKPAPPPRRSGTPRARARRSPSPPAPCARCPPSRARSP